jgi:enoyl-CoA hydratase/carnithine racemase
MTPVDRRRDHRRTEDRLVHYTREAVLAAAEAWATDPAGNEGQLAAAVAQYQRAVDQHATATVERQVLTRLRECPTGTPDLREVADG